MRRCARPDAGGLHALLRQRQVRDAPISSGLFSDDRAQHMAEPIAPAKAARDYLSARRRMRCSHPARAGAAVRGKRIRSEEHTSELPSLMRISYAVFCLKKQKRKTQTEQKYNNPNITFK